MKQMSTVLYLLINLVSLASPLNRPSHCLCLYTVRFVRICLTWL